MNNSIDGDLQRYKPRRRDDTHTITSAIGDDQPVRPSLSDPAAGDHFRCISTYSDDSPIR